MSKRLDKYIEIVEDAQAPGGKTKRWKIYNKLTKEVVGRIKWYGGWRKYVFYHEWNGYMDWDFMRMIADFCEQKTKDHYSI